MKHKLTRYIIAAAFALALAVCLSFAVSADTWPKDYAARVGDIDYVSDTTGNIGGGTFSVVYDSETSTFIYTYTNVDIDNCVVSHIKEPSDNKIEYSVKIVLNGENKFTLHNTSPEIFSSISTSRTDIVEGENGGSIIIDYTASALPDSINVYAGVCMNSKRSRAPVYNYVDMTIKANDYKGETFMYSEYFYNYGTFRAINTSNKDRSAVGHHGKIYNYGVFSLEERSSIICDNQMIIYNGDNTTTPEESKDIIFYIGEGSVLTLFNKFTNPIQNYATMIVEGSITDPENSYDRNFECREYGQLIIKEDAHVVIPEAAFMNNSKLILEENAKIDNITDLIIQDNAEIIADETNDIAITNRLYYTSDVPVDFNFHGTLDSVQFGMNAEVTYANSDLKIGAVVMYMNATFIIAEGETMSLTRNISLNADNNQLRVDGTLNIEENGSIQYFFPSRPPRTRVPVEVNGTINNLGKFYGNDILNKSKDDIFIRINDGGVVNTLTSQDGSKTGSYEFSYWPKVTEDELMTIVDVQSGGTFNLGDGKIDIEIQVWEDGEYKDPIKVENTAGMDIILVADGATVTSGENTDTTLSGECRLTINGSETSDVFGTTAVYIFGDVPEITLESTYNNSLIGIKVNKYALMSDPTTKPASGDWIEFDEKTTTSFELDNGRYYLWFRAESYINTPDESVYLGPIELTVDLTPPVFVGLEEGASYEEFVEFKVDDLTSVSVTANDTQIAPQNGVYIIEGAGTYEIKATDRIGNFSTVNIEITETGIPIIIAPVTPLQPENGTIEMSSTLTSPGTIVTITPTPDEGYELSDIVVVDSTGKAVELTANTDGSFSFEMPFGGVTVAAEFVIPIVEPNPPEPEKITFDDVLESDWYYSEISYVCENGLMNGIGGNLFAPNAALTRAMIVTILSRLDGVESLEGDDWYVNGANWAVENGISDGTMLDANVTREQLVTMIYRYAQYKGVPTTADDCLWAYPDAADVSDWALEAFNWAIDKEMITGRDTGELDPQGEATRAEAAAIIVRYLTPRGLSKH